MSTPFSPKSWQNSPTTTTPLSAAALTDLETRLSNFSRLNYTLVSGTHTAVDGELVACVSGPFTVTLPTPNVLNACVAVLNLGSNIITVTTPNGLIEGAGLSASTSLSLGVNTSAYVLLYATAEPNWVVIGGQQDTGWIAVSGGIGFTASWANSGGALQTAAYRLIGTNVYLRGTITGGTGGGVAFTLPTGFRPPATVGFTGPDTTGTSNNVAITSGGALSVSLGAAHNVALDNMSFPLL